MKVLKAIVLVALQLLILACLSWFTLGPVSVAWAAGPLTVDRMYSADYCVPCKLLHRDLAANGANITIIPVKNGHPAISEYPTVVYTDGTTDTGKRARMLDRKAFKGIVIRDYELVTR